MDRLNLQGQFSEPHVISCQALEVKPGHPVRFTARPGLKFGCFRSVLIPHGHGNTYRRIYDEGEMQILGESFLCLALYHRMADLIVRES